MNIVKQISILLKQEKQEKQNTVQDRANGEHPRRSTTLQHRLILFFACVAVFLLLLFTLLLMLFGINGREEKTVQIYVGNELDHISQAVYDDFGKISVSGLNLAKSVTSSCDAFFKSNSIVASELAKHPELLEPLLAEQIQTLIYTVNSQICGGAFILLDATVHPGVEDADFSKSGIFLKKTQPVSIQPVAVKDYYLRGPANIARDNGIELLGQWKMEYDITDEPFFTEVMDVARQNPDLPISRLYYWTGRVTLKGNSESGFLLCVPLRSFDGYVFGVCGIEVSSRMFKLLYSPNASIYENVFTIAAPALQDRICAPYGIIAGNYYLTGNNMSDDLLFLNERNAFERFAYKDEVYGEKSTPLRVYSSGSPYEDEKWSVAVMMPEYALEIAVRGNSLYLFIIVGFLLFPSLFASIWVSRRFLRPITNALSSIRENSYEDFSSGSYLEINDLFVFLAQKDRETDEKLMQLGLQNQQVQSKYEKARSEIARLTDAKKSEVDPECFNVFLANLHTLTPKEREIFNLYLDGKSAKDIQQLSNINENTLKFHNKNIYSKLGVSSRKQLLMYAALMKSHDKEN